MATLQIQEPNAPVKRRRAVGIDLGTTHSLVAWVNNDKLEVLSSEEECLLPSVVRFTDDKIVVGKEAKAAFVSDPENTFLSIKRFMGRSPKDILSRDQSLPYKFVDETAPFATMHTRQGPVNPIQVSSFILKSLMERVKEQDSTIDEAVITVPAYFDEAQRQATLDAAKLANIKVLRLLNEPTAAAVAYGLDKKAQGSCLVFDFGGGTFDVSLLSLTQGVFEVLATGGDTQLGGDDIDHLLAQWLQKRVPSCDNYSLLLMKARELKEGLSTSTEFHIKLPTWQRRILRETLNSLIEPLVEKMLDICQRVLLDAKKKPQDIDHVVLVGGSTRIPYLQDKITEFFGQAPLTDLDPDKVVSMGAAIQANVLAGNAGENDALLLDVIPLSLGLEMMGGVVEKILTRNTAIPAQAKQIFTTQQDGQSAISFHIVQGERELAKDCRSLAHFDLVDLPPLPAGQAQVEVNFQVDADGLLTVKAVEVISGVNAAVNVKPTYGLTREAVVACVEEAISHATSDVAERKRCEVIQEGSTQLHYLNKIISSEPELLGEDQRIDLLNKMQLLSHALEKRDTDTIKQTMKELEAPSQILAEAKLNAALKRTLVGNKASEMNKIFS